MRNITVATGNASDMTVVAPIITLHKFNGDLVISVLPVTIFIGVEAVIGFVGNILILCVYSKWYTPCNFRYFVLCLAIYDLTSCLTTLPGEMFSQFHWYDYPYDWICKTKSYFNVFTAWGSAFTLQLLAFDRYKKICRPLGKQIQPSFALKLCVGGIVISSLVSIPSTILWGTHTYTSVVNGVSLNVSVCEKSEDFAEEIYPFIYVSCVYILPIGLMMLAVAVLNVLIARKLFCKMFIHSLSKQKRERLKKSEIKRKVSESSNESKHNCVAMGIGNILQYTSSLMMSVNLSKPASDTDRQSSIISLCSISVQDRREISENKTDFHETLPATKPRPCNSKPCDTKTCNEILLDNTPQRDTNSESRHARRKRKTLIMLVLTSVFIVTMSVYIALVSLVAETDNILRKLSNSEKVTFFLFWRLYFVNSVVNPILYGAMDPRFRSGIKRMLRC